jgi:hypothetical protein
MSIELWRLVLLTTVVLVAVIAFALAIKPLASGQLGPVEAVTFMLVAMPPMLAYALPFASCFGATLAYHRMVADNEIVAAHAAGLSHRALLAPAVISGMLLAGVLVFLNAQVIPRFVRTMQEMVADDLARAIVTRIESGQPVERRDMILSAQTARVLDPSEMPGARSRVLLTGVAALLLDEDRMPREELFARSAQVWVLPGGRDPEAGELPGQVIIQVRDGFLHSRDGSEGFVESLARTIPLPNAFRDDPAFLTTQELDALDREPERMNFIEWRRVDLAYHLAARAVLRRIAEDLRAGGGVRFEREGETIVVRAQGLRERQGDEYYLRPMEASRRVEIEVRRPGPTGLPRLDTFEAHRAFLKVDLGDDWRSRELSLDLTMRNYAPTDIDNPGFDEQTAPIRQETEWTGLRLPGSPERELLATPSDELLRQARAWAAQGPDPELTGAAHALATRVDQLGREVGATRHARAAMAVSCLVMIIGGALAAMRMRGALPLAIYCWAFFPAIGALVTIAAGKEMVHRSGMEWLVVLWGGVLAIAVLGALSFRSVART